MTVISSDSRIYCQYAQLVKLKHQAQQLRILPNQLSKLYFNGRHQSLFRGRGLNFEELRHYRVGDDIRYVDWKVTLRTGKPHVRSYSEEKDRQIILCVDQRQSMFFSSVEMMKSVVAAEIAALWGWHCLAMGDRVGWMMLSDVKLYVSQATRSQSTFLSQLQKLSIINQDLNSQSLVGSSVNFSEWIKSLLQKRYRYSTIILISDWRGCSTQDIEQLKVLQQHNDVLAVVVQDPMEVQLSGLPIRKSWTFSDGSSQVNLTSKDQHQVFNHYLELKKSAQRQTLTQLMARQKLPYIEVDTSGKHFSMLLQQLRGC